MVRYTYWELMGLLTCKNVFVMKDGERYFFAKIVE